MHAVHSCQKLLSRVILDVFFLFFCYFGNRYDGSFCNEKRAQFEFSFLLKCLMHQVCSNKKRAFFIHRFRDFGRLWNEFLFFLFIIFFFQAKMFPKTDESIDKQKCMVLSFTLFQTALTINICVKHLKRNKVHLRESVTTFITERELLHYK